MAADGHNRRRFKLKAGEYDWYKEQVARDPEFLAKIRRLATRRTRNFPLHNSPAIRKAIAALADEYDLTVEDVDDCLVTVINNAAPPNNKNKGSFGFDWISRQANITYSIDSCSDTEARELFEKSLAARRQNFTKTKQPKRRLPEDTELLYAIHRAHKRNLSREAIFNLYASGKLTNSAPNLRQYSTPADLMGYYYKHTEAVL